MADSTHRIRKIKQKIESLQAELVRLGEVPTKKPGKRKRRVHKYAAGE